MGDIKTLRFRSHSSYYSAAAENPVTQSAVWQINLREKNKGEIKYAYDLSHIQHNPSHIGAVYTVCSFQTAL